ncbi:MAG: TIGR01777 family oxidoreductase [Nesterenkonia sp.]
MSHQFSSETYVPFSREDVFSWYTRPGALTRLHPPFAGEVLQEPEGGPVEGSESVITLNLPGLLGTSLTAASGLVGSVLPINPPSRVTWRSRHEDFEDGRGFTDVMVSGPMRSWRHERQFLDEGPGTLLRETVTYELPATARLPRSAADRLHRMFEPQLRRIFAYRERQMREDLAFHQSHGRLASQQDEHDQDEHSGTSDEAHQPQVVAVSGASGMVGTQVCALLGGAGIQVRRLVRRDLSGTWQDTGVEEIAWDPVNELIDDDALAEVDAVIHLAGHPLADRFTEEHKHKVEESRVRGTSLIADALARMEQQRPAHRALISGSAIGWYGATAADRTHSESQLSEDDPAGTDFLAGVCQQWEDAAQRAEPAGVRVVSIRTGIVQSPTGGALERMLPLFALGVGGPLGGDQVQSWISLDDIAALIVHMALTPQAQGPINAVAPEPVTAREYAQTLGAVLRRPAAIPVPSAGPKLLLGGQGAKEMVLADQHVSAQKAQSLGYGFRHQDLAAALRHLLGR